MVNFLRRTTEEVASGTDFMFFLQMRVLKKKEAFIYIKKENVWVDNNKLLGAIKCEL